MKKLLIVPVLTLGFGVLAPMAQAHPPHIPANGAWAFGVDTDNTDERCNGSFVVQGSCEVSAENADLLIIRGYSEPVPTGNGTEGQFDTTITARDKDTGEVVARCQHDDTVDLSTYDPVEANWLSPGFPPYGDSQRYDCFAKADFESPRDVTLVIEADSPTAERIFAQLY